MSESFLNMPEFLLDIDARIYYALTDPDAYKLTLTLDQIFSPAVKKAKLVPQNKFLIYKRDYLARKGINGEQEIGNRMRRNTISNEWKRESEKTKYLFTLLADKYRMLHDK